MLPDAWGFLRPSIDEERCTECGVCATVCPALAIPVRDEVERVWWAYARDEELLGRSSSGGVFGAIALDVLARGGVVYGAVFGEGCSSVRHARVVDPEGLARVTRSKYVQSSVGAEMYVSVERDLAEGLPVLFSGTTCQVAGLSRYLELRRVDITGLLRVDVVCHGAPSPALWAAWVDHMSEEMRSAVAAVSFRDKRTGWESFSVAYVSEDGSERSSRHRGDWYMRAFLANASLRPSCHTCPVRGACGSDLTLGDFWGIGRAHPGVPSQRGVSAVVARTPAGIAAVEAVCGSLELGESDFGAVLAGNPCLERSVMPHPERAAFMAAVGDGVPVSEIARRWSFEPSLPERAKALAGRVARKLLRR